MTNKYLTKCSCGGTTSRAYARKNGGRCKSCVTGVSQPRKSRSYDDIAREGGYEDTMGVSPEALENYYSGGYHGDY